MKFNETVEYIAENLTPVTAEMARPKNPEFQKWKEENPGKPTYLFYKAQRAKKTAGTAEPVAAPAAASAGTYKELPDTKRTKEAVAEFMQFNPDAGFEEVLDAVTQQSTEETPLNLDPGVVKAAMDEIQGISAPEVSEPDLGDIKKTDLADRYERMRQALYKARGLKGTPGRKGGAKGEEDAETEVPIGDLEDIEDITGRRGPRTMEPED